MHFLCRCGVQAALTNLTQVFGLVHVCRPLAIPGKWQSFRVVFFFPAGVGSGSHIHLERWAGWLDGLGMKWLRLYWSVSPFLSFMLSTRLSVLPNCAPVSEPYFIGFVLFC